MNIQTIVENMTTNLMKDKGIDNPILFHSIVADVLKCEYIESYSMDELSQFVSDTIDLLKVKPSITKETLLDTVEAVQNEMNKAYDRAVNGSVSYQSARETIEVFRQAGVSVVNSNFKLTYTVNAYANMLVQKLNKIEG